MKIPKPLCRALLIVLAGALGIGSFSALGIGCVKFSMFLAERFGEATGVIFSGLSIGAMLGAIVASTDFLARKNV